MLETLKISNLAIIDEAEVHFKSGLNILSGETGTGKSIVLQAISLILGSRASSDLIRSGCEEATVSAVFEIRDVSWLGDRLRRLGLENEHSQLLVRRVLSRTGRHRIYINGELATRSMLVELCEGLVDLCGQHEHQSLLKSSRQLELVDHYAGIDRKSSDFRAAFSHYRSLVKEREALGGSESERNQKLDFLKFQIDELEAASLQEGEDVELQKEKEILKSARERIESAERSRSSLEADEGALEIIRVAQSSLARLAQLDPSTVGWSKDLDSAILTLEEVALEVSRYLEKIDLNPDRLTEVEERLALIANLRRKYGDSVGAILKQYERLSSEYQGLEELETRLESVEKDLSLAEAELLNHGKILSDLRKKSAKLLSDSVTQELKDLRMGDARLRIQLEFHKEVKDWTAQSAGNRIQFEVCTNKGDEFYPLGRIASGGELSRIMLSIRRVISDQGGIGVYLFDEVDAGIGGRTAFEVGKKLRSVAKHNQVICITHLPQVAAFANAHFLVSKTSKGNKTLTQVLPLETRDRDEEIARMLGGEKLTPASLKNAKELVRSAAVSI